MRNILQEYADKAEKLTKGEKISTFGDNFMVAIQFVGVLVMGGTLFAAFAGWAVGIH